MKKQKLIKQEPVIIEEKKDFILEAIDRANSAFTYHRENMDEAENDVAFIFGDHYSAEELRNHLDNNRVAMIFNRLPQFINKVVGAQRATVNSIQVSSRWDKEEDQIITPSFEYKPMSEALNDIVRGIEYDSNAKDWYKVAFKHMLEGGFGYLRVYTEYTDDSFDQVIRIKGVRDRWSVLVDPMAQEPDMSDMNYCFVSESMTKREFETRYPNKSYDPLPGAEYYSFGNTYWETEDMVTVSEYFWREPVITTLALGEDGETYDYEEAQEAGIVIVDTRESISYKVFWSKISQGDILEEKREFFTSTIPVVPMLGRQIDLRGKRWYRGLIHDAIDSQIAINKMMSSSIERIDSSPITPFVATDKAIEGYENMWAEANTTKFSTLVYRKGEERPIREQGATVPVAELNAVASLDESMKSSIGIFNASLGEQSNEISGRAIMARKQEGDVGTFEFIDNYNTALKRIGTLLVELIPHIYDTSRKVATRDEEDNDQTLELNKEIENPETGEKVVINKIKPRKRVVEITTGQTYETRSLQNANEIIQLMNVSPKIADIGADLLVKNLNFADSDTLAKRLEKTIPQDMLPEEQQQEVQPPQPTPEENIAQINLQIKQLEMQAKEMDGKIKVDIEKERLEIEKVRLQQAQTSLAASAQKDKQATAQKIVDNMLPKKAQTD